MHAAAVVKRPVPSQSRHPQHTAETVTLLITIPTSGRTTFRRHTVVRCLKVC
jgi:hypothetical protein